LSEEHSLIPATVSTEAATMVNDEVEGPAGQYEHTLDTCREKGWEASRFEIQYRQAAQWCYMAATGTEFQWSALSSSAEELFGRMSLKHLKLRRDDRALMNTFWVKCYHQCCETARGAVGEKYPRPADNNQEKLEEAYANMGHFHQRFSQGFTMPTHGLDAGDTISSTKESAQSTNSTQEQHETPPGECSVSSKVCCEKPTGSSVQTEYSEAADYFYKLENDGKELDWGLFSCDLAKQFDKKRVVWTFMAAFRYQVKLVHNDCTTIKWAQRREGAKAVRRSRGNTDLAAAYNAIKLLLPTANGTESTVSPRSSTLHPTDETL
jgi:hypothetical protein